MANDNQFDRRDRKFGEIILPEVDMSLNLSVSDRELIRLNQLRRIEFWRQPELFYPWWR